MKTTFISLLLVVAGVVSSLTATAQQTQRDFCLRKVQITFDVNPNNPDVQYLNYCTLQIPDGTPDYYVAQIPVSNYSFFEYTYNSPELLGIDLHLQYPYTDRINSDVSVSSTQGDIQYYKHAGSMGTFGIRCETPIEEGQKYLIKIRVGY